METTTETARTGPAGFVVCDRDAPLRETLENFVARCYRQAHDARVTCFLPTLIGLRDPEGRWLGVGGLARAERQPLFLESYLDRPVEALVSDALGLDVARSDLAEVGNLAAGTPGTGVALVSTLAAWLAGGGVHWGVFTATRPLRQLLRRLGADVLDLAPADPDRLGAERADWGSYYDHDPRVCAASTAAVVSGGIRRCPALRPLCQAAHDAGSGTS